MLEIIVRILISFITPIASYLILENFLNRKSKLNKMVVFFLICFLSLTNLFLYSVQYSGITTMLTFLLSVLTFKIIYSQKFLETIISSAIVLILLTVGDLFSSLLLVPFFDIEQLRENVFLMGFGNSLVAIISITISKIKYVKNLICKFIDKLESNKVIKIIAFLFLSILLIVFILFLIYKNFELNSNFMFGIIILIILLVLIFIYINENNEKNKFEASYNALLKYSQTFEEIIDNDRLMLHEYKNELVAIKNMRSMKEVKNYIDANLQSNDKMDKYCVSMIKNLPSGGIKGLIYYKLITAKQKGLNITIDVSPTMIGKKLSNDTKFVKELLQVVGICFDNAIEASEKSLNKELSVEIYMLKDKIHCVICNTFDKSKVQFDKIDEKGYSTKGFGRGNGLYYLKNIVGSQNKIKTNWKISNKYFIRTIIVEY